MTALSFILAFMPPSGDGAEGGGSFVSMLIFFGLIILIMYFLIIRPQQKRQKEHQKMLSEVNTGTKVITTSGIHGTIREVHDTYFLVEVADNVKVRFEKAAVASKQQS